MTVADAYLEEATSITDTQTLQDAAELFVEQNCSDLMIIQQDGRFVGICSEGDLIRKVMHKYSDIKTEGLSSEDAFDIIMRKGPKLAKSSIMDIATTNPITVSRSTSLNKATKYMVSKNIRRLPVVEDGKLIGVLTRGMAAMQIMKG